MAPAELRQLNIKRFQRLILAEIDLDKLAMIKHLLDEERLKPDNEYPPADPSGRRGDTHPPR